jgi:glucose-1-phosphate thymidylyltransferase
VKFKAVIPAAGEGRRLKPHTLTTPKVLLQVADKPIIGHIMDRLLPAKPSEVVVVVGAQGESIRGYLESAYRGCPFTFVTQTNPRGLGDAVYRAKDAFDGEPVLVLLGDTILDIDMREIVGKENVIGVKEVSDPKRFGIVEMRGRYARRLVEKPEKPAGNLAIVGVYFFRDSARLFGSIEKLISSGRTTKGEFQLTDALQLMLDSGVKITAKVIDYWLDCGTRETMLATNRHLLLRNAYFRRRKTAVIIPPVYIHDSAVVEDSVIGPNVSVGADARVTGSVIRDSIINWHAVVDHALLEESILGENSVVRGSPRKLNLGGFSELEMG